VDSDEKLVVHNHYRFKLTGHDGNPKADPEPRYKSSTWKSAAVLDPQNRQPISNEIKSRMWARFYPELIPDKSGTSIGDESGAFIEGH